MPVVMRMFVEGMSACLMLYVVPRFTRSRSSAESCSRPLRSFCSHCCSTSHTVSSVRGIMGCPSTFMSCTFSARCSVPALSLMRVLATLSYFCLLRSQRLLDSPRWVSYSSTIRRLPELPDPLYLSSSTRALAAAFSSFSLSMRACASLVICLRLALVSSCVMNFWITSETSLTPVASLILRNASPNVVIFFCSSSICCTLEAWKRLLVMSVVFMAFSSFALRSPAASALMPSRSFSRASILAVISCLARTCARRSESSFSRCTRSWCSCASTLASSALDTSFAWLASCDMRISSSRSRSLALRVRSMAASWLSKPTRSSLRRLTICS
mmetsp:Transcript_64611/g.203966  ORF Transcript_64611/g.203966 Transcript_64611/m.203966 type:complete len:328 (-) Transcript_64611:622-1605(-)